MLRVVATRDLLTPAGPFQGPHWHDPLRALDDVTVDFMAVERSTVTLEDLTGYDAAIVWRPRVPAAALPPSLRLIARWGVGLDNLDLPACAANGTLVTTTPDGVARAVATANLALMLALDADLLRKDLLVRSGRWSERLDRMGTGFSGRALGSLGFGHIAQELFRLARPLDMRHQATTPRPPAAIARSLQVEMVGLERLLETSDVLCINCPLTPETRGMVGAAELARMKPTALLINTARGAIIDEGALAAALREGRLRGAALDVFATEPVPSDHPLLSAPNVILSPHATAWSDEMAQRTAASVLRSILELKRGERPTYAVGPGPDEGRLPA